MSDVDTTYHSELDAMSGSDIDTDTDEVRRSVQMLNDTGSLTINVLAFRESDCYYVPSQPNCRRIQRQRFNSLGSQIRD